VPVAAAAVVAVIIAVVAVAVSKRAAGHSAPSATGPSACVLPGKPATGASWKVVTPLTLCGLLRNNTAQIRQADESMVTAMQGVVTTSDINGTASVGTYTSAFAQGYQVPANSDGVYRSVSFTGLDGSFSPAAAVAAVGAALDSGSPFRRVPAGPHGGAMECAPVSRITQRCVWATASTLGVVQIIDTTMDLVGSHLPANAVLIRDALEVHATLGT
jgi:hypothetical protein